jgi:hypothetical protein
MKINTHTLSYLAQFISEREMFKIKNFVQNTKTHLKFNKLFFENHTIYEIIWKSIVHLSLSLGRRLTTILRMHISCWITNATYTYSEYLLQQWLQERASMLRYTYVAFLLNWPTSWVGSGCYDCKIRLRLQGFPLFSDSCLFIYQPRSLLQLKTRSLQL